MPVNILAIDIGGTNVKFLATGQTAPRKFPSGPEMTPEEMVAGVLEAAQDWDYEVVSIGFPGPVLCGQPMAEPVNLGPGWMEFDYAAAFGRPVKVINDAAMQALGSYHGGKMLFFGLGTGVGATVIQDGVLEPLEIGRFHYKKHTLEYYVGAKGRKRLGHKKWQQQVEQVVERIVAAIKPSDVVLGGGNAKKLDPLPAGTRLGDNSFAFVGGFRLWDREGQKVTPTEPAEKGSENPVGEDQQVRRRPRYPTSV
ncbi:MAG: ROK family protein [Planctomycetes bacterium]|nr:ROK family protein [Planctomycetota bacterium]